MRLARRAQFAVLVVLLHAGLVLALLVQRTIPLHPPEEPALAWLDIAGRSRVDAVLPALPAALRPHEVPRLEMPEPRYPVEPEAAAITLDAAPNALVAAGPAGTGSVPPSVRLADYLVPLQLPYPRAAKRRRAQGLVLVYVLVDSGGLPLDVQLYRSSGDKDLDGAALRAVRKALFKPQTVDGVAVSVQVLVPVNFNLGLPGS